MSRGEKPRRMNGAEREIGAGRGLEKAGEKWDRIESEPAIRDLIKGTDERGRRRSVIRGGSIEKYSRCGVLE